MMQQEFEKLTKVKVTSEEYNVIEAAYMACQEDKQVFCKQWLKKRRYPESVEGPACGNQKSEQYHQGTGKEN